MAQATYNTQLALWIFLLTSLHANTEDGDAIDCAVMYKQPAFNHPLLKNHSIQIKPSSYPRGTTAEDSGEKLFRRWDGHGKCPEGKIPIIRRKQKHDDQQHPMPLNQYAASLGDSFFEAISSREYAQVSVSGLNFHGLKAGINVWNPSTDDQEYSLARVAVIAGTNIIEAGWMVNPRRYKDNKTRLFLHWTHQSLGRTRGCYDLDCPGFVQTCSDFIIGSPVRPVSEFGTHQFYITMTIYKDIKSGNWWVKLQDKDLGYWPSSIITSSGATLTTLTWGGEILNSNLEGHHTATQMGSGRFPRDKFGKSSFFRNLGIIDESNTLRNPTNLAPLITTPSCYDLQVQEDTKSKFGIYFFYGGPGRSDKCP